MFAGERFEQDRVSRWFQADHRREAVRYQLGVCPPVERSLRHIFHEEEIYRIDHYLGKETVQNILVLRFSNGIFEPLWNHNYIDSIEISATETLGWRIEGNIMMEPGRCGI